MKEIKEKCVSDVLVVDTGTTCLNSHWII